MPKIIVVDDDKTATSLFEQVLLMYRYEVIIVNESSMAVEIATRENPDLLILDLMMPEPDGFKLCRNLLTLPKFKRTPIIIVTAMSDLDSKLVAMGAGASDYLVKPFHIDQLLSMIDKQLNGNPPPAS
jgi:two-component system response regulator MprA